MRTPGPWEWWDDGEGLVRIVEASEQRFVAQAVLPSNARLIALTPELFEYVESSAQNGCATAQALIAKANGEQVHSDPLPKEVGR